MDKQKQIGYAVGNVAFNKLPGYKDLWNQVDFNTKEYIVNQTGKVAMEQVLESEREFLTKFAVFVCKYCKKGDTPANLVDDFYNYIKD